MRACGLYPAIRHLDIYIAGSNSRFLSSDIATEFRGRGTEIKLRPFLKLNDGFGKPVITGDDVPRHVNSDGITVMNVIHFMKDPSSLENI